MTLTTTIAVRAYVREKEGKLRQEMPTETKEFKRVLVFDTETTSDTYQNLLFGSYAIYDSGALANKGIFYNPKCVSQEDVRIIQSFATSKDFSLYTTEEFVDKIFYPETYHARALCIGFNLPFDLSRLAMRYGYARGSSKGGFSFKLSKNKKFPRIKIRHVSRHLSFIKFGSGLDYDGRISRFQGHFLDLKTLAFALTDKDLTLASACELFATEHKKLEAEQHGKVTKPYIKYNINDVLASHDLYRKLKAEFDRYGLDLSITRAYSPASLGKACLCKLGIKPFSETNPRFPSDILGYAMLTYYGGRSEVKIRKKPTKVVLLDFLSMYPTVCTLQNIWAFLIAKEIQFVDDTDTIRKFIENLSLEDLQKPEIWKMLLAIVEVEPDGDVLPVRARYGEKNAYNIGINYLTAKTPLWYTLADVIASKLLSGKVPKIKRAIRFLPMGAQDGLGKETILGIDIDPIQDDLFERLIEERQKIKERMQTFPKDSQEHKFLFAQQKILKIIANATSYGIFIEANVENRQAVVEVFGLGMYECAVSKVEKFGKFYNPIVAVFITGAARLFLAIVEALLARRGNVYAFCDTDSMAVSPECVEELQSFFRPLNPYGFDSPLLQKDSGIVWFYGISAKRYVLYEMNDNGIKIYDKDGKLKYSSHGLGHLTSPFGKPYDDWHKVVWLDILKLHYGLAKLAAIREKYSGLFAIAQLTISNPTVIRRLRKLNMRKRYHNRIKPFNFFLVGIGNCSKKWRAIKPIAPFSQNPQEAAYCKFVDYNTGNVLQGLEYWTQLADVLDDYMEHPEAKSEGDTGILKRRQIIAERIVHIGKEATNLETAGILEDPVYNVFSIEDSQRLLRLSPKEASKYGIARNTLWYMKRRASSGNPLRLSAKIAKPSIRPFCNGLGCELI